MLKTYFKIAWRNLWKKKLFSVINILGLTLGLAFAGIIGVYVFENLQVDKNQPDNLYRVTTSYSSKTLNGKLPTVGRALVPAIEREVPEVEKVIPVINARYTIKKGDNYFFDKTVYAGQDFLTTFNFPLLEGNAATALKEPYSVVLTRPVAEKYFGSVDVVGKTLLLNDTLPATVTAVLKDLPPSHMAFDMLVSFSTWQQEAGDMNIWFTWDMTCYVLLKKEASLQSATAHISALSMNHNGTEYRNNRHDVKHELERVKDIYLHSPLSGFNKAGGNAMQLYVLSAIGLALLLLACINFINLTTAYQAERSKEIGVRKTIGATALSLVGQFMTETLVIVLIAAVLATGVIFLLLPFVEEISGQELSIAVLAQPAVLTGAVLLIGATTVLAGWYPSFLLSRLKPVSSIKMQNRGRNSFNLRKVLVVFQFAVSLVLVTGTIVAAKQLQYMRNKSLGFNKDAVVVISLSKTPFASVIKNYESIKHQLSMVPGVNHVTASAGLPGRSGWNSQLVLPEGFSKDKTLTMEVIPSDQDYVKTLGITIQAGRDLSPSFATDATNGVLINETACRLIGWTPEQAIGKMISTAGMEKGQVIGVMNDYNQHGLQQKIGPVLLFDYPYGYSYLAVSTTGNSIHETVDGLARFWKTKFPGYPFEYFMLDDDLNNQYKAENNLSRVVGLFSFLTILIAALGLFGLTTFIVIQKTKEIGIRKILGANVANIIGLISKDFLLLVITALLVACPVAWWLMDNWLQEYSYRIEITIWLFVLTGLGALLFTLLIVGTLTIKTARMKPVKSLRME